MPEIGTSGSMSEDGKRSDWQSLKHRAFPRLYTPALSVSSPPVVMDSRLAGESSRPGMTT
jgi:hypothetical protein